MSFRQNARDVLYKRLVLPAQDFIRTEVASGVVILVAAIIAMIWANVGTTYVEFWQIRLRVKNNYEIV